MINKTYKNFIETVEILQNQAYMSKNEAERLARKLFETVKYDRTIRKVKSTVEEYLITEIEKRRL